VVGGAQVQIPVVTDQLQQKPYLFLAFVMSTRIAADEPVRHLIAQPVTGSGQHLYMLRHQPHFFMQFTEHGLLGVFTPVNAALWKLPRVGTDTLAPKYLTFLVEQDDADVGPEAVPVEHNQTSNFLN
jgi:hypothetical protein